MFALPGRFGITFTGMRVTGHDGKTPHHLIGIKPDVPVAPTIAGLRAGRDEVLERALKSLIANPDPESLILNLLSQSRSQDWIHD